MGWTKQSHNGLGKGYLHLNPAYWLKDTLMHLWLKGFFFFEPEKQCIADIRLSLYYANLHGTLNCYVGKTTGTRKKKQFG